MYKRQHGNQACGHIGASLNYIKFVAVPDTSLGSWWLFNLDVLGTSIGLNVLSTIEDALKENSTLFIEHFNDSVLLNRCFMQLCIHAVF